MERPHFRYWPDGMAKQIPPSTKTLDDNLRETVARYGENTALIFYGAVKTYRELDRDVTRIASYLQSVCQLRKGDRVGLFMQNCPQFIAAYYGIIRAGGCVVPISAMQKSAELQYILDNAGISIILTAQDVLANVLPLMPQAGLKFVIACHYGDEASADLTDKPPVVAQERQVLPQGVTDWRDMLSDAYAFEPVSIAPSDICVLPYTSGSTGQGKGCGHSHATTQHAVSCIADWFGLKQDSTYLVSVPMFHVIGMQAGMNAPISKGSSMVIMTRWDRDHAARLIRDYEVTVWSTVPTAVIDFLNRPDLKSDDLSSLRVLFGGGSSMPQAIAEKLLELTGLQFVEVYGMTEAMGPITNNPQQRPKNQCAGIPVANTDILICDVETGKPVSQGEVGEVVVFGPQIMLSYWHAPQADAEAFVEINDKRGLRTGDLGRLDEDGYLYIVDRLKRMINISGYKVWPTEVETYLYKHPAIAEVCVISAKDDYRGETVKAVAVLKPDAQLTAADLTAWAQHHMAAYKVPRLLEVVEVLPKSNTGKVLWRVLQDRENQLSVV